MATDSTGSKEPTKHLFDYQKKLVVDMLQDPKKHICFMECGLGKGPSSVMWGWAKCKQTHKHKLLVVTTASKTKVTDSLKRNDFEQDADSFGGDAFHETVTEFETVSWDLLYKWVDAHKSQLDQWVYIIDECLPSDTDIVTDSGIKKIDSLRVGDKVLSYNCDAKALEYKTVTRTIKRRADQYLYRLTLSDGTTIISTGEHPHYTDRGYVAAKEIERGEHLYVLHSVRGKGTAEAKQATKKQLQKNWASVLFNRMRQKVYGDGLYRAVSSESGERSGGNSQMHMLRKRNADERDRIKQISAIQKNRKNILLPRVPDGVEKTEHRREHSEKKSQKIWGNDPMHILREAYFSSKNTQATIGKLHHHWQNILLSRVRKGASKRSRQSLYPRTRRRIQRKDKTSVGRTQLVCDEGSQSKGFSYKSRKRMEANLGRTSRDERRERKAYRPSAYAVQPPKFSGKGVDIRASSVFGREPFFRIPDLLQIGHRKRVLQNRGRMRRKLSPLSQSKSYRQEKGRQIERVRVDSVEILKLSDIKRAGLYRDPDYVYCIDVEDNHNFFANGVLTHNCFKGKTPTSRRGKAFIKVTNATNDWTGYTATPGQVWIDFLGYFIATGLVRNKTAFMREFCNVQTFKGFPEIVGYYNEDTLKRWWAQISIAPDASKAIQELPKSNYDLTYVSKPKGYSKVLKMRRKLCENGEVSEDYEDFIDNPSKLTNYLRRMCWTEKKQWVADYLEGLGEPCLIFYNYINTGNDIEQIAYKVLPNGAKVWRIDGSHHEIPTRDTIGKYDVVLSQWQSGSEGLNLEFITEWLAVEPTYSFVIHHQGKKRVMRIGQTRPVFYHMLISKGTIEEDILKCIREKKLFSEKNWLISQKLIKEEK